MAETSEYELLPHEELQELRDEIARLKQDPLQATSQADDLKHAVDRLTVTLNKFISLMTKTNDEMLDQFQQTSFLEQFARINANQEQIAKGIISVAKMVKKISDVPETQAKNPQQTPQSPQNQSSPSAPPSIDDISSGFPEDMSARGMSPNMQPGMMTPTPNANYSMNAPLANDMPPFPPNPTPQPNMQSAPQNMQTPQSPQNQQSPGQQNPFDSSVSNNQPTDSNLPPPPPHKHGLFHRNK
jgi:hypothetical protein